MPKVFSKPTKHIIASDTDSNKENISLSSFTATLSPVIEEPSHVAATVFLNQNFPPPQPNAFHLPDIVSHFDWAFPNHTSYRQYVTYSLGKWASDPLFTQFNTAYCHHRLVGPQIVQLSRTIETLQQTVKNLQKSDQVQQQNIEQLLSQMESGRLGDQIERTLFQQHRPNQPWVSQPKEATPPSAPTPIPTPTLHTQMSLPDLQSTKPTNHAQRCYTCNSTTHLRAQCPKAPCLQHKGSLPKHLTTNCPQKAKKKDPKPYEKFKAMCTKCRLPLKYDHVAWARGLSDGYTCWCDKTPKKEESSEPDLYNTGYYDVYRDEDSNLNGECWNPTPIYAPYLIWLIFLLTQLHFMTR